MLKCYNSVVINWVQLIFHAVWVTGFAILIGQFSFLSWKNSIQIDRKPLTTTGNVITIVGTLMTGVGLAIVSTTGLQRIVWLGLTSVLLFLTYRDLNKNRSLRSNK